MRKLENFINETESLNLKLMENVFGGRIVENEGFSFSTTIITDSCGGCQQKDYTDTFEDCFN